jgi:UDPglucose 6-dehydrogenase
MPGEDDMELAVVGTGYVGLVGGACLAEIGHNIVCVDRDPVKIQLLLDGGLPIYEPGLDNLVPKNVEAGRLHFTTELEGAVRGAEAVYIAVGTPQGVDGGADLSAVEAVAAGIAAAIERYTVVIVKSTVPVGTCDRVAEIMAAGTDVAFDVVSNPEFLREGVAVPDFLDPDRIVIGVPSDRAREVVERINAPLTAKGARLFVMDVRSSELTKYASNSMLATRISFMNEIARLCDQVGADVEHVRAGMGSDSRIGPAFLRAGVGYGGSCFPKDVQALLHTARASGVELQVLDAVERANTLQKSYLVDRLLRELGPSLSGKRIALWGLSFKPDTDDMRQAPSLEIIEALLASGATVVATDPVSRETAMAELGSRILFVDDAYSAVEGADALLLVTEWSDYRTPDWSRVASLMKGDRVYDGRNLYAAADLLAAGLHYAGVGRGH